MPPQENQYQPDLAKDPGSPATGPAEPPPQSNTPLPGVPATPPTPPGPPSQYDFMLKDPQAPAGKLAMLSSMPKPMFIGVVLGGIVLLIILFSVLLGGSNNNYPQILDLAAKNQEIIRVNTTFQRSFTDQADANLSATTVSTLTSEQVQYLSYLAKNKYKYKSKQLSAHINKVTDATLQAAIGSNTFDSAYLSYLNTALQQYQAAIQTTNKSSTKNFSKILQTAFNNNKVLLASPILARGGS